MNTNMKPNPSIRNEQSFSLQREPFRGIVKQLAEEQGVSRPAICKALQKGTNIALLNRFAELVEERKKAYQKAQERIRKAFER